MPSKNPAQRLRDIAENIEAIREFTSGMDVDIFVSSRRTIYAVTRALEIISEASRRLPDEIKARHPALTGRRSRPSATSTGMNTKPWMTHWSGTRRNTV